MPPNRDSLPDQGVCTACRGAKTFPPMDLTDDDVCANCEGTGIEPAPEPRQVTDSRAADAEEIARRRRVDPMMDQATSDDIGWAMVTLGRTIGAFASDEHAAKVKRVCKALQDSDRLRAENETLRASLRWALGRVVLSGCLCPDSDEDECTCGYSIREDYQRYRAAKTALGSDEQEAP